jgi:hypothetical protein
MDKFEIVDVIHCESFGLYPTLAEAWAQLGRLATCSWNAEPNVAPCGDWETCGREYEIVAYNATTRPWQEGRRPRGSGIEHQALVHSCRLAAKKSCAKRCNTPPAWYTDTSSAVSSRQVIGTFTTSPLLRVMTRFRSARGFRSPSTS